MSEAIFTPSAAVAGLYWLDEPALPAGCGVALLLPDPGRPTTAPLTLRQSWTGTPGLYLVVGVRPAADQEAPFAARARRLPGRLGARLRFAWVVDPTPPLDDWQVAGIFVDQAPGAPGATLSEPAALPFGCYTVGLACGVTVTVADDGFLLAGATPWASSLRTPARVWPMTLPATGPALPFAGAKAGCLLADLTLADPADLDFLDVGLRMAVDDPDQTTLGLLRSLRYPVFTPPAGSLALHGQFDAARPLEAARTLLAFADATPALGSYYRNALGYAVTLTPAGLPEDASPAGLAFHKRPGSRHDLAPDDPFYLAPAGTFALGIGGPAGNDPVATLACGISGLEYFGLPSADATRLTFIPGQAAHARNFSPVPPDADRDTPPGDALDSLATCAWALVRPDATRPTGYYAQPDDAALFTLPGGVPPAQLPYLTFLPISAGQLAAPPTDASGYPLFPYAGIVSDTLAWYKGLETRLLAPARREALMSLAPLPAVGLADGGVTAATPQGLLATFNQDHTLWQTLQLTPSGATGAPPALAFNTLTGPFRQALQSNQLFLVAADSTLLLQSVQLNYWLTPQALADLADLPAGQAPPPAVLAKLRTGAGAPQTSLAAFQALLGRVLAPDEQVYVPLICRYGAYFELVIDTWRMRLSPTLWNLSTAYPTLMICKFASADLHQLVADPNSWNWPQVGALNGSVTATRDLLLGIIDQAVAQVEAAGSQPDDLDFFVNTVVRDPSWNGILFLNANVPVNSLPDELRGLAAGLDISRFRAHHVGLTVTPIQVETNPPALTLANTSSFGLIDYEDPQDISQSFNDFDFKVLQLRVLFQNSHVANFASRIELFVNRLFGAPVNLAYSEHYNNLILTGSYQRQQGAGHYLFVANGASLFLSNDQTLESIEIDRVQFNTLAAGSDPTAPVRSRFAMWGRLRFYDLPGFDLFSFGWSVNQEGGHLADGYLVFGGLAVEMSFAPADPTQRTFALDVGNVAFDLASSLPRPTSLFRRFPLQAAGLLAGGHGQTTRQLGYVPVATPLAQPSLPDPWFGLLFTLDLGTLGALAGGAGLVVTLIAAWGYSPDSPAVNVGLRLPGAQSINTPLPIEGVLDLGFQSITLSADGALDWPPDPAYVMRLRHFYLRILGWRFPPGQADISLFGDPELTQSQAATERGALGWYAAYKKK